MTDDVVHALAEQWLPIPMPEFKDLPPTAKATMANPMVLRAQQQLTQQMLHGVSQAAEQQERREKYVRAVRSRREKRSHVK